MPTGETLEERRANLVKSIEEKTKGGGAVYQIRDGLHRLMAEYKLSHGFLMEYFRRVKITVKSRVHNMGCEQCPKCKSFHRLDKLKEASDMFDESPNDVEWNPLFKKINSECE